MSQSSSLNTLDTAPEQAQTESTPQITFEPDLFMDGYVSCCLSAGPAEQYFRSLTGTSQSQDTVPVEYDKSTQSFRTMDPQTRGQPVDMLVSYKRGLVIPQAIPAVLESKPNFGKTHPIFFLTKGLRDVGVLAQDLVLETCPTLEQPDYEVNLGSQGGHLITISWPSYRNWALTLLRKDAGPVSMRRLAYLVGQAIRLFVERSRLTSCTEPALDIVANNITMNDILLIGLVQIYDTPSVWMPILQLLRTEGRPWLYAH